jgi:hypothetical protein
MKRQFFAMGLLTVFSALSLTTLTNSNVLARGVGAGLASFKRVTIQDQEPNNVATGAQRIGALHFQHIYNIQGKLRASFGSSSIDAADHYSFNVGRKGQYVATLDSAQPDAVINLYQNNTLIAQAKSGGKIDRSLDAGDYRLEVTAPPSAREFDYKIPLQTPGVPSLRLTVVSAKALSKFDDRLIGFGTEQADFRIKPTIAAQAMTSKKIDENDAPAFNHQLTFQPTVDQITVPIGLRLSEEDPGSDETADISPDTNQQDLQLTYVVRTGEVFGSGGLRGKLGEAITVAGTSGKKASITFKVD